MSATAKPLRLRLFLEGEETPVVAANITCGLNGPAAASIQIVPIDKGMEFKPRTMVHLFYLDVGGETVEKKTTQTIKDTSSVSSSDFMNDISAPSVPVDVVTTSTETVRATNYKLAFAGEVVGFSSVRTPQTRALVLQCLDFSSYWDVCHMTSLSYGPAGNALTETSWVSASDNTMSDDIVSQQQEVMRKWLRGTPQTLGMQKISGLAGGLIKMLETMGGVAPHFKGVNDFFTVAELRCRLLAQITAEENDNSARRLLDAGVFAEWLESGVQNMGTEVSFRDMLKLLSKYIFYDTIPVPSPKFDPGTLGSSPGALSREPSGPPKAAKDNPLVQKATSATIPNLMKALETAAFEPDRVASLQVASAVLGELGKLTSELATLSPKLAASVNSLRKEVKDLAGDLPAFATGNNVMAAMQTHRATLDKIMTVLKTSPEMVSTPGNLVSTAMSSRLRTQIMRPDCFFAAPPRCNVLFPENYSQFNYDRSFLAETTRVHLRMYNTLISGNKAGDALMAGTIVAPSIGRDAAALTRVGGTANYRNLMKHELHTGILPADEWIPNTVMGKPDNEAVGKNAHYQRRNYGRQVALFHFFKYRFAARTVNGSGPFNPGLVIGFPSVLVTSPFLPRGEFKKTLASADASSLVGSGVLDLVGGASSAKNTEVSSQVPSQLVGMMGGLSHNIDQGGGVTNFSLHHVRRHYGTDDEFAGVFLDTASAVGRIRTPLLLDTILRARDSKLLDQIVSATPQQPSTSKKSSAKAKNRSVTDGEKDFSVSAESMTTVEHRDYVTTGLIPGKDVLVNIPAKETYMGATKKGVYGGVFVGIEVVDADIKKLPDGRWAFRSVVVHEDLTLSSVQRPTPIEDIIKPAWISGLYGNANIGDKIYQPFFGCGAITDELATQSGTRNVATGSDLEVDADAGDPLEKVESTLANLSSTRGEVSIERAVNILSYLYGMVKTEEGADVDAFIRAYTYRPIATLEDMLGSEDLEFRVDETSTPPTSGGTDVGLKNQVKVVRGRVGFHSMATHPAVVDQGNMVGLLEDPELGLSRADSQGKSEPVPFAYDVRKDKKLKVREYLNELGRSRGIRG